MNSDAKLFFRYWAIILGYYLVGIILVYTLIVNILGDRTIFFSVEKGGYNYFSIYAFITTLIFLFFLVNKSIQLELSKFFFLISLLFFVFLWTCISFWDVNYNMGSYESTCKVFFKSEEVFCYKYYKDSGRYYYYMKIAFAILMLSFLYKYSKDKKN